MAMERARLVTRISRKRRAELLRRAFDILREHPNGLPASAVFERIERSFPLTESERSATHSSPWRLFEEVVWLGTIAPAKAGWLRNDLERWLITEEGWRAYDKFQDPEEFMARAGKLSWKGWASVRFPQFYSLTSKTIDRLIIEYKLIRRVGLRQLFGYRVGGTASWREVLPLQKPRRVVIPGPGFSSAAEILGHLDSKGLTYAQGGHTIYLPPSTFAESAFRALMNNYPRDAGLKIVKYRGGVADSAYIHDSHGNGRGQSVLQKKLVHDHICLSLVANLLFTKGLGPRLYDLIELQCGDHLWTAYVIEHVNSRVPTVPECEAGVGKIRELEEQGLIKNNIPGGWDDEDFECPKCNGNALVDDHGKFHYIDFQNFTLVGYRSFLRNIAMEAIEKTHFGENQMLRGGRYLYQSVPGVRLPGKRTVETRIAVLRQLMERAGVSVEDRLVLDVGCNIGMMMGQYLKLGARWCHGWDRVYVTPHTEQLLRALGCTRFSTTGDDIDQSKRLERDLPDFLQASLDGCVISYLAVRGHLGWLDALGRIPWAFLIYEGHEDETQADFESHLAQLKKQLSFKVGSTGTYQDGDSNPRILAILIRETG